MKRSRTKNQGFTLIELLVSVSIFSIVIVMALGALLALSSADRRAEVLKSGVDNMTFALDSMSRAIRTGSQYHCGNSGILTLPQDCSSGGNYLTFLASNGVQTFYQFDTAQDASSHCGQTALPYGCIERSTDGGTTWIPVTSPDIVLQNIGFLFKVVGSQPFSSGDTLEPKVIMTVSATVPVTATQTTVIHMETSATQRIYDQ